MRTSRLYLNFSVFLIFAAAAGCAGHQAKLKNGQGVQQYAQGNYTAAIQSFEGAIAEDAADACAYYNIGATRHHIARSSKLPEDFVDAENYYRLALRKNANFTGAYRNLAVLFVDQGREKDAFDLLTGWSLQNPTKPEPKLELARLYEEFGRIQDASNCVASAYNDDRTNYRVTRAFGYLREMAGDPKQALAAYKESLQHNAQQPDLVERVAYLEKTLATH